MIPPTILRELHQFFGQECPPVYLNGYLIARVDEALIEIPVTTDGEPETRYQPYCRSIRMKASPP